MVCTCAVPWWKTIDVPRKQHQLSSNEASVQLLFCRQRKVKRAAFSRAANLWPYLLDKSIEMSESRPKRAVGELEGLPLACCPRAPHGGYLTVSSPSIPSASARPLSDYSLLHTHTWVQQSHIYSMQASSDISWRHLCDEVQRGSRSIKCFTADADFCSI